jgi:hypothetical protein
MLLVGNQMANTSKAPPIRELLTLGLFQLDPAHELERAKAIVRRIPLDARWERQRTYYWRAVWTRDGKHQVVYVGDDEKRADVERAQELVRQHMIAQGLVPPRPNFRKRRGPPPASTKAERRPGGRRSTASISLRDSDATDRRAGVRSPAAANGSRRRV